MFKPHRKQEFERELISHANVELLEKRDEEAWTNPTYEADKSYKKERTKNNSQHGTNYVLQSYLQHKLRGELKSNIHLTVGRQRL